MNPIKEIAKIKAPKYINTSIVSKLGGVNLTMEDILKIALSARLNIGLGGGSGMGKSQLIADAMSFFGNNATYVLGRNDLDIKQLFMQMNFAKLNEAMQSGGSVSQKDISNITSDICRPLVVVEEINRCAEIVQNQLFNIFEGYIELGGKKYALGKSDMVTIKDTDGTERTINLTYSVGLWSANFGNGQYTGTVPMDKALKERSHLIIDVDNFVPKSGDIDRILLGSEGEVRLKETEGEDLTKKIIQANAYLRQQAKNPDKEELPYELLIFRYLVDGLAYIPVETANNDKRKMKEVWPSKAEEDNIGTTDNEKIMYRMIFPCSIRSAETIMTLARAMREYVRAADPKAEPTVIDSVAESFKIVAPYSGIIDNPQRVREDYVGNNYLAGCAAAEIIREKIQDNMGLLDAVVHFKITGEPMPQKIVNECKKDFECLK